MNAALSEDLIDETEYEQIPAIYTSEDEHMQSPTDQTNNNTTSHSSIQPENANLKTTTTTEEQQQQPLKKSTDNTIDNEKNNDNSNDDKTDSSHTVSIPAKKRKLPIPSGGLVSYAIDDDEDENTVLDTDDDDDASDDDGENTDSDNENTHSNHASQSNHQTGQPPTIFSSDQPVINILSQNQIHLTEFSTIDDAKTSNPLSNETMKPESLTERLIREIQLPPEPTGHCSMVLQERVERAVRRMRLDISYDPNRAIQDNKAFRNPSIYEKLIDFLKIDEKGSNFPKEIYDPYRWGPQSYYEELAKVQNREIDRLMKLQKEQKKTEASTTTATTAATTTNTNAGGTTSTSTVKSTNIPNPIAAEKTNPTTGGSVYTGYIEPKRPSKWDIGMPINLQSHETTSTTTTTATTTTITTTEPVKQQSQQQQQPPPPPSVLPVGSLIKRNC